MVETRGRRILVSDPIEEVIPSTSPECPCAACVLEIMLLSSVFSVPRHKDMGMMAVISKETDETEPRMTKDRERRKNDAMASTLSDFAMRFSRVAPMP